VAATLLAACASPGIEPGVRTARVYPALGQFPDQQERDSHACSEWAKQENAKASGFGGAMQTIGGAVTGTGTARYGWDQDGADRAYRACMNGRGYSVVWE
jgi:hypothetical protein